MSETGIEDWDTIVRHEPHPEDHPLFQLALLAIGLSALFIIYAL